MSTLRRIDNAVRDGAGIDKLRFVDVDREDELVARVKVLEIENDLRAAIDNLDAVDRKPVGADDRKPVVLERSQPAGRGVEEQVAVREAVLALVQLIVKLVERRAGRAAL